MRIRGKLVSIVGVAVLVPLCFSILYIHHFGRVGYRRQQQLLYQTIAQELSDTLSGDIRREYEHVSQWLDVGEVAGALLSTPLAPLDAAAVRQMESQWNLASGQLDRDPFAAIFSGEVARVIQRFQRGTPRFAEILVTDRFGRLAGATNPTTDYWQADESWWQAGAMLPAGTGITHHVNYDTSAAALVIDMVFPVFSQQEPAQFLGVLKASLHAQELFQEAAPRPWDREITRDICFQDGRVLTRIRAEGDAPVDAMPPAVGFGSLLNAAGMSMVTELYPGTVSLCVAVPIPFSSGPESNEGVSGRNGELYVVVHRDLKSAMAPVASIVWQLAWLGIMTAVIFATISYLMGSVWFAAPLRVLRRTALSISEHIQQSEQGLLVDARQSHRQAVEDLRELQGVKSGDELQELAEDFARMGARVLTFNRELERELTEKTEEINSDLAMAREFQEALLPQSYPDMQPGLGRENYALHFDHIYRPALSVSGDFFDITKVSDHCVRVFIADVMGHGARSALMTAVLHALIHSVEKDASDPGDLLQRMNDEFVAIGSKTEETIFVTAVHLIIDTSRHLIRYASAGHPPPLLLDHATGRIAPLVSVDEQSPAVGLIKKVAYQNSEVSIEGDQTLLLYTDGVTEAMNVKREEFGESRLLDTVASAYRDRELERLPRYILESLETFMDVAPAMDDICLVSVDITRA